MSVRKRGHFTPEQKAANSLAQPGTTLIAFTEIPLHGEPIRQVCRVSGCPTPARILTRFDK